MAELLLVNPTAAERDAVLASRKVVFIDFYASWCAPCKGYSPKFQRMAREVRRAAPDASLAFLQVDIDLDQSFARAHSVRSVPTTVVLADKKGWFGRVRKEEVLRFAGDRSPQELLRDFTALAARYGQG
ncbi:MAG TPA: thioredoxin family protein [Candidatus Thermoplasmatota archaeon]|nr:thioredoxin family protein [Candidatus Thermoplasmatota archaeon]